MTSNTVHVARAGCRANAWLADDLKGLEDQLNRCTRRRSRWISWQGLAHQLRIFTATHVVSVAAVGVLTLSGLTLFR